MTSRRDILIGSFAGLASSTIPRVLRMVHTITGLSTQRRRDAGTTKIHYRLSIDYAP